MTTEPKDVESRNSNETEQPEEEKPCLPCLLPQIMGSWTSVRASCEFLPNDNAKAKCREQMIDMAKSIKDIKSAEEVIYRAICSADDPEAFIDAEVNFAKAHNAANSTAILKWADEQEAKNIEIPERIAKIVKALRLSRGSDI
ncbi:MAG: hypothetical protein PHP89_05395 [Candidatus Omnitrophica bacterium]|nr:hypothetical protein [Candidatus Omnitrophota bacterium]